MLMDRRRGGRVEPFGRVVEELPAAAVLERRPGTDRPVVVELPIDGAHAGGAQPSPVLHAGGDGDRLLHLAEVDEVVEPLRHPEVPAVHLDDLRVAAAIPLVMLHHRRGDVELILGRVGLDGRQGRERLVPELRAEAGRHPVVGIERMTFVPDIPVVHVAPRVVVPAVAVVAASAARRAGPVKPRRVACIARCPHRSLVEPVVIHQVPIAILPRDGEPVQRAEAFVVAAPDGDAGVIAQPLDLVGDLRPHVLQKVGRGGVEGARKHEVVPDENALLVAEIIETVLLVLPAAPDADHVHVGIER